MSRFNVALVRFSTNGRLYPVNCDDMRIGPGTRVIVRMVSQSPPLQPAEVVEVIEKKTPCKNSIVCLEINSAAYGNGPQGVYDKDSLDKFLTGYLNWRRCATARQTMSGRELEESLEWPLAYSSWSYPYKPNGLPEMIFGAQVILVGSTDTARISCSDDKYIRISNGKLILDWHSILKFENMVGAGGNQYSEAAKFAEGDLTFDLDPPADTTLRDIRDAITGGVGGPAYLSDGEWL